ncbi:MAG: lipid II:glycine glycyltransferase FemX [Anaerolineales bacterium]|jgi:lipid II:glycine glycyltransferase (peptidoglycan interpeptide bridge formation enzyme)
MGTTAWNELISSLHHPHLLQTSQWADFKSQYGWRAIYLVWDKQAGALRMRVIDPASVEGLQPAAAGLLLERTPFPGLSVQYLPKGPLFADPTDQDVWDQVFQDLEGFAKQRGALQLKIDPDVELGQGVPGDESSRELASGSAFQDRLASRGWRFSEEQVQFRNTVLVDLRDHEDEILARMKSKTRYNIRLAARKGIRVRQYLPGDLDLLYRMYAETSSRGGFTIRGQEYYQALWTKFIESCAEGIANPCAQPLIAEYEGLPIAAAVIFAFGERAWYLHGMSVPEHTEKMPTYLVQWEAMRWAKERGCATYDMWGAPDHFSEDDSLWGVYRFKDGFGGEVSRTIGAWDFPARPLRYQLYTRWLPRLLDLMRWVRDRRTSRLAESDFA